MKKINIVGLGKLGASMAAAIADRGFHVVGVDIDKKAVEEMNAGRAPVQETGLGELIEKNRGRLRATTEHVEAVLESDISFVIVPTPSDERGAFSLQYARWAFEKLGAALALKKEPHLVVMTSTVLPGACRKELVPVLEATSGSKAGKKWGFCYSPEFIALGSVIRDFLNPDFTLIGEWDKKSGDLLEEFYSQIMLNSPACCRMSLENAELTKISVNSFITTKIAFANTLAELCGRMSGGDVDAVTHALGCDKRIGARYLKGGMGFGGSCFPRDNKAFHFMAAELGVEARIAAATDGMNQQTLSNAVRCIQKSVATGSTVGILGLAYKPFSHVVEQSQALQLARMLAENGYRVLGYDPLAGEMARMELRDKVMIMPSARECIQQADMVVMATPDPEFAQLSPEDFENAKPEMILFDFWRVASEKLRLAEHIRYVAYGRGG